MPLSGQESLSNTVTIAQPFSITPLNVTTRCYMHFLVSGSISPSSKQTYFTGKRQTQNFKLQVQTRPGNLTSQSTASITGISLKQNKVSSPCFQSISSSLLTKKITFPASHLEGALKEGSLMLHLIYSSYSIFHSLVSSNSHCSVHHLTQLSLCLLHA